MQSHRFLLPWFATKTLQNNPTSLFAFNLKFGLILVVILFLKIKIVKIIKEYILSAKNKWASFENARTIENSFDRFMAI